MSPFDCTLVVLYGTRPNVMSAAVSVHLESASPLIDVPTVRDPEIRCVDGSVH